jgi:dTMP kinase
MTPSVAAGSSADCRSTGTGCDTTGTVDQRSMQIRARLDSIAMRDHAAWSSLLSGRFVVFDGPDGSGKSTQFRALADAARASGIETVEVREPGGTPIGERIRDVLLDPALGEMVSRCEMLLYMASRAQLMAERVQPALTRGAFVLADRFISSTLAYQGSAGGVPEDQIRTVGGIALGGRWPDLVVIFDVDWKTAQSRMKPTLDRVERKGEAYHARVRAGYLDQARHDPARYLVVDSSQTPELVFEQVSRGMRERLAR